MADIKMVSMKRTPEDKREDMGDTAPIEAIAPDYPWGLCLNLDADELKKLGIKTLPAIGAVMTLQANVKVTQVNQSAVEGRDEEKRVNLQITDMGLSGD